MTALATRHIGMEPLRAARQILFEGWSIYVQIERDNLLAPSVPMDVHDRWLVDISFGYDDGNNG
jgi:propanediol utilization protein